MGTIIHDDIQSSLFSTSTDLYATEVRLSSNRLKLAGHADVFRFTWEFAKPKVEVYDFKTAAPYKWSKLFGHKKNRDPNPHPNYEYQLATYALMAEDENNYKVDKMSIIYIKLDEVHKWREVQVDRDYVVKANEYWEMVNFTYDMGIMPEPGEDGSPYQSWECDYCPFSHVCPTPFKKKK